MLRQAQVGTLGGALRQEREDAAAVVVDEQDLAQVLPLLDLPATGPQDDRPGISDASPQELLSWFADRGDARL